MFAFCCWCLCWSCVIANQWCLPYQDDKKTKKNRTPGMQKHTSTERQRADKHQIKRQEKTKLLLIGHFDGLQELQLCKIMMKGYFTTFVTMPHGWCISIKMGYRKHINCVTMQPSRGILVFSIGIWKMETLTWICHKASRPWGQVPQSFS